MVHLAFKPILFRVSHDYHQFLATESSWLLASLETEN